jgi:hypothetical protein
MLLMANEPGEAEERIDQNVGSLPFGLSSCSEDCCIFVGFSPTLFSYAVQAQLQKHAKSKAGKA